MSSFCAKWRKAVVKVSAGTDLCRWMSKQINGSTFTRKKNQNNKCQALSGTQAQKYIKHEKLCVSLGCMKTVDN